MLVGVGMLVHPLANGDARSPDRSTPAHGALPAPLPVSPACSWLVVGRQPAHPARLSGIDGMGAPRFVYLDLAPLACSRRPPDDDDDDDADDPKPLPPFIRADFNLVHQVHPFLQPYLTGSPPLRVVVVDWSTWRYLRPLTAFPHWIAMLQEALACPLSSRPSAAHPGHTMPEERGYLLFENGISSLTFEPGGDATATVAGEHGPIPWEQVTFACDNWSHLHLPRSVWSPFFQSVSPPSLLPASRARSPHRLILSPKTRALLHRTVPGWARFWGKASAFLDGVYARALAALPGVEGVEVMEGVPFPLATSHPIPRWVRVCVLPASESPPPPSPLPQG
jgi:hypothetical protein